MRKPVTRIAGRNIRPIRLYYPVASHFQNLISPTIGRSRSHRKTNQLRDISDAEFFHNPRLVDFDGARAYAQGRRNFLGVQSLRSLLQHLALSGCETVELFRIRAPAFVPLNPPLLQREGGLNSGEQLHILKGFFEKIHGLGPERCTGRWYVPVRRNNDERQNRGAISQCRLQFNSALSWQSDVGDHAPRPIFLPSRQKRLGISEHRRAIARKPEHERNRIAYRSIIVNDEDG